MNYIHLIVNSYQHDRGGESYCFCLQKILIGTRVYKIFNGHTPECPTLRCILIREIFGHLKRAKYSVRQDGVHYNYEL